ncbi:hypothetical protein KUCAC02_009522 [Chaenocephalus aceratus]|nr:hypothetical protein KUCAC02_009522 [Chaenocephalus aceratus]
MKLLLLLAVAASQMELSASQVTLNAPGGNIDISVVPITFYGKIYTWLHVKIGNKVEVCFKNDPSEDGIDCLVTNEMASTKLTYAMIATPFRPHPYLFNIKTQGLAACHTNHPADRPFAASLELSAKVGDRVMDTWKPPAGDYIFRDLSGCRGSGGAVMPGSEMPNLGPSAEPCSVELCSLSAVLANVTACGPEEFCQADNT